jgi:hypothetical protein
MKLRGVWSLKPPSGIGASSGKPGDTGRTSRFIALVARVAVMNSPLTIIDPAAPSRRNPVAIGAGGDELRCGRGVDHDEWTRNGVANVFVALGEAGRRYRYASYPDRNNGERQIGHDITKPKATCLKWYHAISEFRCTKIRVQQHR